MTLPVPQSDTGTPDNPWGVSREDVARVIRQKLRIDAEVYYDIDGPAGMLRSIAGIDDAADAVLALFTAPNGGWVGGTGTERVSMPLPTAPNPPLSGG